MSGSFQGFAASAFTAHCHRNVALAERSTRTLLRRYRQPDQIQKPKKSREKPETEESELKEFRLHVVVVDVLWQQKTKSRACCSSTAATTVDRTAEPANASASRTERQRFLTTMAAGFKRLDCIQPKNRERQKFPRLWEPAVLAQRSATSLRCRHPGVRTFHAIPLSNIEAMWTKLTAEEGLRAQLEVLNQKIWKDLTMDEKKSVYYVSSGSHSVRTSVSKPSDGLKVLGGVLVSLSDSAVLFLGIRAICKSPLLCASSTATDRTTSTGGLVVHLPLLYVSKSQIISWQLAATWERRVMAKSTLEEL
ncbi:hypothetical protein BDZ89DRAFT_1034657 [Hymenopellis radicata]|nr:hypothetical protein BDZ89DRAFT_1034657 [Hymenopellis radicata]